VQDVSHPKEKKQRISEGAMEARPEAVNDRRRVGARGQVTLKKAQERFDTFSQYSSGECRI
jgi:hypothetical protein